MSVTHNFDADFVRLLAEKRMVWAVNKLATVLQRWLKKTLNTEGTGTHWPNLPKRSSSPGSPPVVQTGTLLRSWTTKALPMTKDRKALFLGSPINYAKFLQTGTKDKFGGWRILPRPYLELAIAMCQQDKNAIAIKAGRLFVQDLQSKKALLNTKTFVDPSESGQ